MNVTSRQIFWLLTIFSFFFQITKKLQLENLQWKDLQWIAIKLILVLTAILKAFRARLTPARLGTVQIVGIYTGALPNEPFYYLPGRGAKRAKRSRERWRGIDQAFDWLLD